MNLTSVSPEIFDYFIRKCSYHYENVTKYYRDKNVSFCPAVYDKVKCWQPTEGGIRASQQCPREFLGHVYNIYEKAERYCFPNGTWESKTNYESCYRLSKDNSVLFWLYIIGYSLSFFSLCSAFMIFTYFKSLRCLRNIIHCNLILSFIIRIPLWMTIYVSTFSKPYPQIINNIVLALHMFSQVANFFWMFVEGIYLFIVIVWTYRIEKVKIWHFGLIGWVLPALLTIIWIIIMVTKGIDDWAAYKGYIKLIVHLPIVIILVVNSIVLIFLVITLFNKLKATTNLQVPNRRTNNFGPLTTEYKKALKSTVVLMPLLGFTHIIFICNPPASEYTTIFYIINAIFSSSQGFWVSLIYCFNNGEVRITLRNHIFKCARFQSNIRMRHTFYNIPSHRQSVPLFNQQLSDTCQTSPFDNHKQIVSLMQKLHQSKDPQNRMNNTRRVRSQMFLRDSSDISLM